MGINASLYIRRKVPFLYLSAILLFTACENKTETGNQTNQFHGTSLIFDTIKANYLYSFAFECIDQEYPNKTGHVMGDSTYLATPGEMHPAFYGCFDWHSSVHGHWTLVSLLSEFPGFRHSDVIVTKLTHNITSENVAKEVEYLLDEHNRTFERTYGWAWLLKLDEALREWEHPFANQLQNNLQPLSDTIADRFSAFLEKLNYPIRVGEHNNTAFALSLAYDFAEKYDSTLADNIRKRSRQYYMDDSACPISWEPSGFDFLSPCLQEASLMMKVLEPDEYQVWLGRFLPGLAENPGRILRIAEVTDRSDGNLAHLDGLNFSRAWCLYEIGYRTQNQAMIDLADAHFNASYTSMDSGEYAGTHWLASFATFALKKSMEETSNRH